MSAQEHSEQSRCDCAICTPPDPDQTAIPEVQRLVQMVEKAIDLSAAAKDAIKARDVALDRLCNRFGGDRIAAIRNGQQRIGELMTEAKEQMSQSSIVAAFPATGKTWYAERHPGVLDSDSSAFSWLDAEGFQRRDERKRHPDWPHNYVRHIKEALFSGRTVLVSTHAEVRTALADEELPLTLVYPRSELRVEYLVRMAQRGSPLWLIEKIDSLWDGMIAEMHQQDRCDRIVLGPGKYLADALEPLR